MVFGTGGDTKLMKATNKAKSDYDKLVKIMFDNGLINSLSPTKKEFEMTIDCIIEAFKKEIQEV